MIGRMLGWLGWMWFDLRFVLVDTIWFESLVFPPMISETTRSNQLLVLVEKSVAALMSSNKKAFWGFSEIWESTHVFFNEGWRVFQVFHSLAEGSRTIRIHLFWDSDWSLNPLFLLILKSSTKRTSRSWRFFCCVKFILFNYAQLNQICSSPNLPIWGWFEWHQTENAINWPYELNLKYPSIEPIILIDDYDIN